jgi:hypothetical protein
MFHACKRIKISVTKVIKIYDLPLPPTTKRAPFGHRQAGGRVSLKTFVYLCGMNYRTLTTEEINRLQQQGCTAEDWKQIAVLPAFSSQFLHHVKFTGSVTLGVFETEVDLSHNVRLHSGIYNAWLHNCTVGNNVLIRNIHQYIANYHIDDNAIVCDTGLIALTGTTAFGNGTQVRVVNETGTHAIPMFNTLSAQLADLLVAHRPNTGAMAKLAVLIRNYCRQQESTVGQIAAGARITGCQTIEDVYVGPHAVLENVSLLKNGSICSDAEAPVYIGTGCACEHFIIQSGATLNHGVLLSHCLIGQGGLFDKQFSAEHSLFFANCQGMHGEATAIFAGPHTVTHHKNTLLIAGLFSFMNAGSGTNQSNHAYKLGPVHHGLAERGVKLASNSYLFWPAHIGAFTIVTGRHYEHPDTSVFPFSYLVEKNGRSQLVPGVNLMNIGTWRDAQKWMKRDRRKGTLIDQMHYSLLNPYTVGKIQQGIQALAANTGINNLHITLLAARKGIKLYDFAESLFLLTALFEKLTQCENLSLQDILQFLRPVTQKGRGEWTDIAGLLCPTEVLNDLLMDIEQKKITSLEAVTEAFRDIHRDYPDYEWRWVTCAFERKYGQRPSALSLTAIDQYLDEYETLSQQYMQQLCRDAQKEYAGNKSQTLGAAITQQAGEIVMELMEQQAQRNTLIRKLKSKCIKRTKNDD